MSRSMRSVCVLVGGLGNVAGNLAGVQARDEVQERGRASGRTWRWFFGSMVL